MSMQVGITNAWPLLLLAAVPVTWWLARSRLAPDNRRRIVLVTGLRALALAFAALALAEPVIHMRSHTVGVVYAFDVSASVRPDFLRDALAWVRQANANYLPAHVGYVVFADQAELLKDADDVARAIALSSAEGTAGPLRERTGTDLERAITASLLGFTPGDAKRLVLITDGIQTQGNVWRELPRLQSEGVRLFTLPAPTDGATQAWIDDVEVQEGARQGEPVTLHVRLHALVAARGRLQVVAKGEVVVDREVDLVAGHNGIPVEVSFKQAGPRDVQVKLTKAGEPTDTWSGSVWVGPRLRVVQLEGDAIGARYLAEALASRGIDVERVTAEQFSQGSTEILHGADVVVLNNVPASRLTLDASSRLEQFVRDQGGGLVFVAGDNTYGKDAFAGSAMERLLPVKFEARRKRKELDLVLLIDTSGSMLGAKFESVKSAALATLDMMEAHQRLAVVAFDSQPQDVVTLAAVGGKRRAEDAISSMTAGGRTNIPNALAHALDVLKNSRSGTKHIILLSDGQTVGSSKSASKSSSVDFRKILRDSGYNPNEIDRLLNEDSPSGPGSASRNIEDLIAAMTSENITLSTVAVGEEPDLRLMSALAQSGGGQSYVAEEDREIPALFVTEARRLLGESLVEESFRPTVRSRSGALTGLDFAAAPALKGFVATRPKRFSEVMLEARLAAPVLAETRYGLGKTVAFLSDATNRWASDWLGWPGYAPFWAGVVRDAARGAGVQELGWQVTRQGGWGQLRLTALTAEGRFRDALWPKVRISRPDGTQGETALRQSAPGTYVARVALQPGSSAPYRFELLAGPGLPVSEVDRVGARTLYYATEDEFRPRPPDTELLKALSERTGGKFAAGNEEIFAPDREGSPLARPLWPVCAGAALLFFLLEIAARRVHWRILDSPRARR